jgi:hypothetical protein
MTEHTPEHSSNERDAIHSYPPVKDQDQLPTAVELFDWLERPLGNVDQARKMNNNAVELFTNGEMSTEQLVQFSVGLAKRADTMAGVILLYGCQ